MAKQSSGAGGIVVEEIPAPDLPVAAAVGPESRFVVTGNAVGTMPRGHEFALSDLHPDAAGAENIARLVAAGAVAPVA
jgi:hypothetical protein